MKETTLCYIEQNNKYLMLFRNKKKQDPNEGKWIGIGGHIEKGETAEECLLREVTEETGLTLTHYKKRGVITFISDIWETEIMHLYTADKFTGKLTSCNEGILKWIDKKDLMSLNLWEGDKVFLDLLINSESFIELTLEYKGDTLIKAEIVGAGVLDSP